VTFYTADYTLGRNGRDAVLTDEHGEVALRLRGSGGVRDERGKLSWNTQPSLRNIAASAFSDGLFGQQAVDIHRSRRVANGKPMVWATVEHPDLLRFVIKMHDPGAVELRFGPLLSPGEVEGDTGQPTADCELLAGDRTIARNWPTAGPDWKLAASRYEVLDADTVGLPEILLLFNARYELWRPHHDQNTFQWRRQ